MENDFDSWLAFVEVRFRYSFLGRQRAWHAAARYLGVEITSVHSYTIEEAAHGIWIELKRHFKEHGYKPHN